MTDNIKVKTAKTVDDARVAVNAKYDDAAVTAHNLGKDVEKKAKDVSDSVQIGVSKTVADAKIAVHEAESKLKKR